MGDLRPDELEEYDEHELVFHPDGRVTRKTFLLAGGAAAVSGPLLFGKIAEAAPVAAKHLPYKANTNAKGHLEFWHFWSSPLRRGAIHPAIKNFQATYKGIHVSDLPVPFGNIFDKVTAAVAAQSGVPDVMVSDRLQLWHNGAQLYTNLTSLQAKYGVNPKAYFPVTWQQAHYKAGKKSLLYGLPFETDIRVMFTNRAALVDAGLSPNFAPKTWSDLASVADKLDQKSNGQLSRITIWPWDLGLDTLVWLDGGDWVNSKNFPTANSSQNIATGNWAKGWQDRYGGMNGYNALKAQSQPNKDMFGSGLQVFHFDQPTYQDFTLLQNGVQFHTASGKDPNLFPYWNVVFLPTGPDNKGHKPWSFSGGFSISVPRKKGRSSASLGAAWEFTKYMSMVGQLAFETFAGNIPTVISMTKAPNLKNKQHWSTFVAALKYQHKLVENKFDVQYPGDVQGPAQNHIQDGSQSPKDALDAAQQQALANMKRLGGP